MAWGILLPFFFFLNGLFFTTAGLALSQSVEPLTAEQD